MPETTSAKANSAKASSAKARQAGRSAALKADSPQVKRLGQVGVAAIGVVYLLLAWIALQVAFGGTSKPADNSGALQELAGTPFGKVLLVVMALGLFAYAVWQVVLATIGFQQEKDTKRTFKRISAGAKAVIGVALGAQSLKLVFGSSGESSSQKQADWTGSLLDLPAGRVLVVLIGLAVIGFAGYLSYVGAKKKFLERLEGGASEQVIRLGQFGWVARGVAFGVLGVLIVVAGVRSQPEKARGLDAALKTLAAQPFGKWILAAVALGFAAYAIFQLITAPRRKEG